MKHVVLSTEELKKLAVEFYDLKIYTSFNCGADNIMSVFMPLMFLQSLPSSPTEPKFDNGNDIKEERKNKLLYMEEKEKWEKEVEHYHKHTLPEWEANEFPLIKEFINDIGMVYEYNSKSSVGSINGTPMFYSCRFLNKENSKEFIKIYKRYCDVRKNIDADF